MSLAIGRTIKSLRKFMYYYYYYSCILYIHPLSRYIQGIFVLMLTQEYVCMYIGIEVKYSQNDVAKSVRESWEGEARAFLQYLSTNVHDGESSISLPHTGQSRIVWLWTNKRFLSIISLTLFILIYSSGYPSHSIFFFSSWFCAAR